MKVDRLPDFEPNKEYKYKAVVFDLDGTIYNQTKLRINMAIRLGLYYVSRFWKVKELFVLKYFREVRDNWTKTDEELYKYISDKKGVSEEYVTGVVTKWIYQNPLDLLMKCRKEEVYSYIQKLQSAKIPVIIFSDYPIEDKIKALGIAPNGMYCPGDDRNIELKPSPMGLNLIMKDLGFSSSEILMVGDRDIKDGEAARQAGVDFMII